MRRSAAASALVLALTFALVLASTAAARSSGDGAPSVFTDPTGDAGTASDISSVTISNDDQGLVQIDVGFATPYAATSELLLYLDTDMSDGTGSPNDSGADYALDESEADQSRAFYKWSGTDWADAPATSTIKVAVSGDQKDLTFRINPSELGNVASFKFFVVSMRSDADDYDDGPSGSGEWAYKLQTPLKLSLAGATAVGGKAGGAWILAVVARRSDTGATVGADGAITCKASSGKAKLAVATHAFVSAGSGAGTAAVCSFQVPKTLKRRVLHGTISVTFQGQTVTKSFTTVVK